MNKAKLPEPFSIEELLEALVYISVKAKLFQPLKSFFSEVSLEWGNVPTAVAFRRNGRRLIVLGRKFFAKNVKSTTHGVHVMLHELLHHLLLHVDPETLLHVHGFGKDLDGLAKDAIINAYLNSVGCAGFMEAFYPPRGENAFLRPNVPLLEQSRSVSCGELIAFLGCQPYSWGLDALRDNEPLPPAAVERLAWMRKFYRRLMDLQVTLKEALEFFQELPRPPRSRRPQLLGNHGQPGDAEDDEKADDTAGYGGNGGEEADDTAGNGGNGGNRSGDQSGSSVYVGGDGDHEQSQPLPARGESYGPGKGDFFSKEEAERALTAIDIIPQFIQRVFRQVISQITERCQKPGLQHTGLEQTKRMPSRLHRRDLVTVMSGRHNFLRHSYTSNDVSIYFDLSGSMDTYRPFLVGLIQALNLRNMRVRTFCFADLVKEVPVEEFMKGWLPGHESIGSWTNGEAVAEHIRDNRIRQAVIVTDNVAGKLETPIAGRVHLCFVEGAVQPATFDDPEMVGDCRTYKLYV